MSSSDKGRTQIPIVCPGHTRPLAELQYLPNAQEDSNPNQHPVLLLSACHDKMPMMRDGLSGDWIGTFQGHKGAVWSCQVDPSCSLAVTGSGDFSARVWDAVTGQSLVELPHKHIVKSCVFSPNSQQLATGGKEGLLRIYDLVTILPMGANADVPKKAEASRELKMEAPITKLAWMDADHVLSGCANGKIYLWDVRTMELNHVFDTKQSSEVRDLELVQTTQSSSSSPPSFVMTIAAGDKVYFFDLSTRQLIHEYKMPIHFREEGGATLHPSATKFVAGGSDLWVRVFDFASGEELECHKGHHGPIRCVRYSPDGTSFATGSEDGTIRLWKTDPVPEE